MHGRTHMNRWIARGVAGAALIAANGCASFAPAEPCTLAWFDYETRQAFAPIRGELSRSLDRLRLAQASLQEPAASLGAAISLTFALESGVRVIEAAQTEALPRLQAAANQCDDPGFVRRAVFDFLDEEGVDELFTGADALAGLAPMLESMLDDAMVQAGAGL